MIEPNVSYKVKGYTNRWSVVDESRGFVLLENETYGDETCYLVVRKSVKPQDKLYILKSSGENVTIPTICSQVYETYDGIAEAIKDYDLK